MKFLYQPVKPFFVTQKFGENQACISLDGKKTIYCDGLNPPVGYKSQYGPGGHSGIDLRAHRWQPVYAVQDGIVTEVSTEESRGLGCRIVTTDRYWCEETKTYEHFRYGNWHFIALDCYLGEKVRVGDLIGYADSTGNSSGDHLHFDLCPVRNVGNEWIKVIQNNTYGKIDPLPYIDMRFALDIAPLLQRLQELIAALSTVLADLLRRKQH